MRLLSYHTIPDFVTSPSDAIVTMSRSPFAILGGKVPILHQPPGPALCVLKLGGRTFAPALVLERDAVLMGRNRIGLRNGASSLPGRATA